ncbi:MAG: HEAT repeat domain-containing protein [Phycisphaerae bacterium]
MQVRRWQAGIWTATVLAATLGLAVPLGAQSKPAAPVAEAPAAPLPLLWSADAATINDYMKVQAKRLAMATTGEEAVAIRTEVLTVLQTPKGTTGTPSAGFMQNYTNAAVAEFGPLLDSKTATTSLNAVILLAETKHINTDAALLSALGNSNAAVRYWAARGLYNVLPGLKDLRQANDRAVAGLTTAAGSEKSPLVQAEIVRALSNSGDPKAVQPVLETMDKMAASFRAKMPTAGDLLAASTVLQCAKDLAAATPLKKPDDLLAVQATAGLMYFAGTGLTNQYADREEPGALSARAQLIELSNAGCALINKIAAKDVVTLGAGRGSKMSEVLDGIQKLTGGAVDKGTLSSLFPGFIAPAQIPAK